MLLTPLNRRFNDLTFVLHDFADAFETSILISGLTYVFLLYNNKLF